MTVTATEAKNRFGQLLEQAQRKPVVIEKAGRRHSVLMSVQLYDELIALRRQGPKAAGAEPLNREARAFRDKYRRWVDEQNADFERHGIWNDEFRTW